MNKESDADTPPPWHGKYHNAASIMAGLIFDQKFGNFVDKAYKNGDHTVLSRQLSRQPADSNCSVTNTQDSQPLLSQASLSFTLLNCLFNTYDLNYEKQLFDETAFYLTGGSARLTIFTLSPNRTKPQQKDRLKYLYAEQTRLEHDLNQSLGQDDKLHNYNAFMVLFNVINQCDEKFNKITPLKTWLEETITAYVASTKDTALATYPIDKADHLRHTLSAVHALVIKAYPSESRDIQFFKPRRPTNIDDALAYAARTIHSEFSQIQNQYNEISKLLQHGSHFSARCLLKYSPLN